MFISMRNNPVSRMTRNFYLMAQPTCKVFFRSIPRMTFSNIEETGFSSIEVITIDGRVSKDTLKASWRAIDQRVLWVILLRVILGSAVRRN